MNPSSFPSNPTIDVEKAINNQNDIALIVSKQLFSTKAKHSNSVFSPASINSALTLAASFPDDPSVSDEILSFLRSSSTDELNAVFSKIASVVFADHSANGGAKITSVNGVWIEQTLPIDSSFKDLFENVFKAIFDRVDFRTNAEQVRIELNKWAEDHTNGLIKNILPPGSVTSLTDRVFGNALYFKGAWEVPFDKSYTKDKEFHLLSGTSVSVPFMSSYKNQYIKAYDGFKVLRIPYRQGNDADRNRSFPYRQVDTNGRFPYRQGVDATNDSFPYRQGLVSDATNGTFPFGQGGYSTNGTFPFGQGGYSTNGTLPFGQGGYSTNGTLPFGQGGYSTNGSFSMYFYLPDKYDGLDDLVKAMASTSGFLDCHVPRCKVLVNEFRIPKFKIAYGLDGQDLGLRSMALYHKACVEIDEEGAEAAAATFAVGGGCAAYMEPPKRIDFVADHPFLFLIREDKTGTVLFAGQIFDPSNKSA